MNFHSTRKESTYRRCNLNGVIVHAFYSIYYDPIFKKHFLWSTSIFKIVTVRFKISSTSTFCLKKFTYVSCFIKLWSKSENTYVFIFFSTKVRGGACRSYWEIRTKTKRSIFDIGIICLACEGQREHNAHLRTTFAACSLWIYYWFLKWEAGPKINWDALC